MKNFFQVSMCLAVTATTLLFSCQKEIGDFTPQTTTDASVNQTNNAQTAAVAKAQLANALAQAMSEKEVRVFLKAEALSMYDGDYDILYSLVKDKKLTNGKTLEETLLKYAGNDDVKQWSAKAPLATIFVPTLIGFTPDTWNTETQTPDVVIDDSDTKGKKNITHYTAIAADRRQYQVDAKQAPSFPVVVIKENERIIAKSKSDNRARKDLTLIEQKSNQVINQNSTHSFYFIGDYNYKAGSQRNARLTGYPVSSLVFYYQHKSGRPQIPGVDRDWVYYKIWPYFNEIELVNSDINGGVDYDWSKGSLGNYYYTEKITGFKFTSADRLQFAADWTEGYLDFQVIFSFIDRSGNMQNDIKAFGCSINQLQDANGNPIDYNPNVELMPWDINRWGDEWKFSVLEYDAGGDETTTITTKSTFGTNIEANAAWEFIFKLGVKLGGSATWETTKTSTLTISRESEKLGDARFLYDYPVIIPGTFWNRFSVGTGSVELAIEPVEKMTDTRPNPYID